MLGTLKGRLIVIIAVLVVCGWYLYSNGLTLGLDLQGGMHLVLEPQDPEGTLTPEARADATDRALRVIRTRIDEFGVREPKIQKVGSDRIIVELAGIRDEARAREVIQQTAFLEFQLVRPGDALLDALPRIDRAIVAALGPEAIPEEAAQPGQQQQIEELLFGTQQDTTAEAGADPAADPADTTDAADTAESAQAADTAEPGAAAEAADTPQAADAEPEMRPLSRLLLESGLPGQFLVAEEDIPLVDRYLALPEVQRALPRGVELRWDAEPAARGAQLYRPLYVLEEEPFMTGEMLEDAVANRDPQFNETVVRFELSRRGGRVFGEVTGRHVGDQLAIVLDREVYSAPEVRSRITTSGQIELGQAPLEEAQDLALVLRAGALPVPLDILEERTVGPSLGQDSIEQGKIAGILGIVLVILIMVAYYRLAGFLAVLALAVYSALVLGGLAGFQAALTLPGIAGLILSLGMAVDANVLIFERIREELAAGRTVRTAVDEGFRQAMSAIVDSNLTTLLTALILYNFGTGPVQGFAVTLSVGIIASFFSAVYVTRTFFLLYLGRKRAAAETLSI